LGDANIDGKVDLNDAKIVLKAALGITEVSGQASVNADVNNDSKVDLKDAKVVLKAALGIEKIKAAVLESKLGL